MHAAMSLAALAGLLLLSAVAVAQPTSGPVRIGVLNDQSGPYSDQTGPGSVVAARMAVEEVGSSVLGRPVEVLVGDHQNKPDVGSAIARRWFDQDGVAMLTDVPTSSVALAVQDVARQAGRVVLFSGAATAELTGRACAPLSAHWSYDTYALAVGTGSAVTEAGGKSWFLVTADYSFGTAMAKDLSAAVAAHGGRVAGEARHPLGMADFSSVLLQAQASGAQVVGLLNAGADTANAIKQAAEFGLVQRGQVLAGLVVTVVDVHALGLPTVQGLRFTSPFYWDESEASREWSQRFFARHGRMPTFAQAGVYSAVRHWLRAVQAIGTTDGPAVMAAMRAAPVEDMMTHGARIREDGRVMRDFYLWEAKRPADSQGEWDLYRLVRTIPAAEAARPLAEGGCPLVAAPK